MIARIHESSDQGVETVGASLTVNPSDPLAKFLLFVSVTLCFADLEILVPEGAMLPPGDSTMIPLNWRLVLAPGHLELLMPLKQQVKNRVTVLAGVTDHDY